ncbi:hypothetical protein [Mesorhizobium sp. M7A.F.Ca.US.008.03.1.1]|uniref:hypothetical protein n=1 Tax=Mesorhizobium sp. M7A.F.Ca.US.008.03.1.1 TaxID=2496742 RepID=UPI0019D2F0FB|nr:hypothetical protein [Mesorhizobium sp. M7A.F.Ca.US.008.03.1.1]
MTIVGPAGATPANGLAIGFVVGTDRTRLSVIIHRMRDGRLRTNNGIIAPPDDAVATFNSKENVREDDHPRSARICPVSNPIALPSWVSCVKWRRHDCRLLPRVHSRFMNAQYVELVLFEQSLSYLGSMNRPFSDRVEDAAEKTAGSVLFDVRVDGDRRFQRIAAIGYGADGTVAIALGKDGHLISAPIDGGEALIAEIAAWFSLSMAEQSSNSYNDAPARLLANLRKAGILDCNGRTGAK